MVAIPVLLSAALLLLLLPGSLTESINSEFKETVPFDVLVENSLLGRPPVKFSTFTHFRGILLGGMTRLKLSNPKFNFTYTHNPNYGPYLESVNGVAGNDKDHTYWELLVRTPNSTIIRPDVGIGCYIPSDNELIILKFSKW